MNPAEAVSAIIKAAGGRVEGAKKLQKLVYLANKAGFRTRHPFTYHYYGVYSSTLDRDLWSAPELISVKSDGSPDSRNDFELVNPNAVTCDMNNPALKLVARLANEEARTLEVLSTIVYVRSLGIDGDGLKRKVEELKGRIPKQFHDNAWKLYHELGFDKQG